MRAKLGDPDATIGGDLAERVAAANDIRLEGSGCAPLGEVEHEADGQDTFGIQLVEPGEDGDGRVMAGRDRSQRVPGLNPVAHASRSRTARPAHDYNRRHDEYRLRKHPVHTDDIGTVRPSLEGYGSKRSLERNRPEGDQEVGVGG